MIALLFTWSAQAQPAEEQVRPVEAPQRSGDGFAFGSYGRVSIASNLAGGLGRDADIVAFGPRIDEGTYFELELRRQDTFAAGVRTRAVATLAMGGEFFHLDGEFGESVAVRNLYLEVENPFVDGLALWAGSRMWRGDDIYLLNVWPLDNLNTIGGGADLRQDSWEARIAFGLARPDDPFQHQTDAAVAPWGFVPADVIVLDRPRLTGAAKVTYFPMGRRPLGIKTTLYGEVHGLPSGERNVEVGIREVLPSDSGYLIGAQVGLWHAPSRSYLNVFARYARGLAVYNPLGVPFRPEGGVTTTERAQELLIGMAGNFEYGPFALLGGAYYRNFRDADPSLYERNRLAEGAINLRPQLWIGERAGIAVDLSYQAVQMAALDERTGNTTRGGITKIGLMPFYSPSGRGSFARPHLRLIYSLTLRDEDAQRLYADADPRSGASVEHFLGVGAEWWFDSTSYSPPR